MELGQLGFPFIEMREPHEGMNSSYSARVRTTYLKYVLKTEIGQQIRASLSKNEKLIALEGKGLSTGTSSGNRFALEGFAIWLLWRANHVGLEQANKELEAYLQAEKIEFINTLWVTGIQLENSIALDNGVVIQPISQMPDSSEKEFFQQFDFGIGNREDLPKCAITHKCLVPKVTNSKDQSRVETIVESNGMLYETALVLNALPDIACLPYYKTSYSLPECPVGLLREGGGSLIYDVANFASTSLPSTLAPQIKELLKKFKALPPPEKVRLERILRRFSQAKRRLDIEERMLDLGITLEMLLLDDNVKDQLSLTLRLRGSWYIGTSPKNRREVFNILKELYRHRSAVAHTGTLGDQKQINEVQQRFTIYRELTEKIVQKMILEGHLPWNKIVLGRV